MFWETQDHSIFSMLLSPKAQEITQLEHPEILSYLPSWEGKDVLDLPAGIGRFTGTFAEKAKSVVAVDFCSHFLDENRRQNKKFQNIRYLALDAMDLDFEENSFDLIFISWLLQYLEDEEVEAISSRLASWIKPGGHLFLRESCRPKRARAENPNYFSIYRSLPEYPKFFEKKLSLTLEGSIQAYEIIDADPFKCFWLCKK